MKKTITTIVLGLITTLLISQNAGDKVFDNSMLHEVRIEFTQDHFLDTLTANYENNATGTPTEDIPYLMGKVTIDGEALDSIGVRYKGFTSYTGGDKNPIKLDFNEFVKKNRLDGLRKLNLNNGFGDPAMQRDAVCYDLHRSLGVSASRTAYAKVFINDVYRGLYLLVEQVDKEFLKINFNNKKGNLFKNKAWSKLEWLGTEQISYDTIFALKTNKSENDWSGFIHFLDILNNTAPENFKTEIEKIFDVDRFLKVIAVDVATNNWDAYLQHGRNYYIYEDLESGIFHWIPWDYNFALGGNFDLNDNLNDSTQNCQIFASFDYTSDSTTVRFKNASFSFGTPSYEWDFGDGNFSTDPNPIHTYASHGEYEVCLIMTEGPCSEELCKTITTGTSNVCPSIANGSAAHVPPFLFPLIVDYKSECCEIWGEECENILQEILSGGDGDDNFEIDQRANEGILIQRLLTVPEYYDKYLQYFCDLSNNKFTIENYFPFIEANKALIEDAVELDTNFLATFETFQQDIGAEGLKKYIQERADIIAHDLDSLNACSPISTISAMDISINEILASNDSLSMIADQDNEYDDWIELYNNTSTSIDLSNTYLSNKDGERLKWKFPNNTTIAANAYLIVWADKDVDQTGLHCNFKLKKSGHGLFLSNGDGTTIDSLIFGEQSTNIAFARRPNGTGDFRFQSPSFNKNNETVTATYQLNSSFNVNVYPNPTSSRLTVNIENGAAKNYELQVFSVTGKSVFSQKINASNQSTLELSQLNKGFYFLLITDELGHQSSVKFAIADAAIK